MTDKELQIVLLGEPEVLLAGERIPLASKQLGLIARVFASRDKVSRERLSTLLWPDTSSRSARHSLSQALYMVRRRTATTIFDNDADFIGAGNIHCDFVTLRGAAEISDWARVGALYSGPFLDTLTIEGAVDFSHWADRVRATCSEWAMEAVHQLEIAGAWEEVEALTRVLITERGRRERNLVSARAAALYHTHGPSALVDFVDGLDPELAALVNRIVDDLTPKPDGPKAIAGPFVGRHQSVRELADLYEECKDGGCRMVLITGEPGIGKTALLDRFHRLVVLRGGRVLTATAHAAEENAPFGIVEQWLSHIPESSLAEFSSYPWLAVIRQVFPSLASGTTSDFGVGIGDIGYHRLLESLRRLLLELASERALVLGIDDLQCADSASIGFIHYLLRRKPTGPAAIVGTIQTDKGNDDIGAFSDWESPKVITLEGLTAPEIGKWLQREAVSDIDVEKAALALEKQTGGNPLLVSALLREGHLHSPSDVPPESVVEFYSPRIGGRSRAARRLLAAISLIGDARSSKTALVDIAGLTDSEFAEARQELRNIGWLHIEANDKLVLGHRLLGQVALSLLSPAEKKSLHGRSARVMAADGQPTDARVAISHDVAGNQSDAFDAATRAVEACDTLHARFEKEFFLKLALSNAPSQEKVGELRIALAELLLQQRKPYEALDIANPSFFTHMPAELQRGSEVARIKIEAEMANDIQHLRHLWDRAQAIREHLNPLVLADTYIRLAGVSHDLGFDGKSLEIAEQIADEISELPLNVETAQHLLRPFVIIALNRGFQKTLERLERLPEPDASQPVYACTYYSNRASVLVAAARLHAAEEDFARSLGIAERYALFDQYFYIHNNLGVCLLEQGRYEAAQHHFNVASQYVDQNRRPSHYWLVQDNMMILQYERGEYQSALEMAETSASERESSIRGAMSVHSLIGLSSLAVGALGRSSEAEREINLLSQHHDPRGNDMSYVHIFLARMLALRDETDKAVTLLATTGDRYKSRNALAFSRIQIEKCRWAIRAGIDCAEDLNGVWELLQGSGAIPLIDRADQIRART